MKRRKVLVCITPQGNSRRLIDNGHEIAKANGAELHILHVEKGQDLAAESTVRILQELFGHAAELGGVVHGICGDDVPQVIWKFIKKERITHVVVGAPPPEAAIRQETVINRINQLMPKLELIIIEREQGAHLASE